MIFSKVKAVGIAGIIVGAIVGGAEAAGVKLDATAVSFITAVVVTFVGWLKRETVGYTKS